MEYVAAGYNMLTDVTFADGTQILNTPGGSWYAASGLVFWRKSVAYVGTAGPDFDKILPPMPLFMSEDSAVEAERKRNEAAAKVMELYNRYRDDYTVEVESI